MSFILTLFRYLFLAIIVYAISAHGSSIAKTIGYKVLKKLIISSGKSEDYADCFVQILKWTGATSGRIDVDQIREKRLADIVCLNKGLSLWLGIAAIAIALCFFCCCCRKRRHIFSKPFIVVNQRLPSYERIVDVREQ